MQTILWWVHTQFTNPTPRQLRQGRSITNLESWSRTNGRRTAIETLSKIHWPTSNLPRYVAHDHNWWWRTMWSFARRQSNACSKAQKTSPGQKVNIWRSKRQRFYRLTSGVDSKKNTSSERTPATYRWSLNQFRYISRRSYCPPYQPKTCIHCTISWYKSNKQQLKA